MGTCAKESRHKGTDDLGSPVMGEERIKLVGVSDLHFLHCLSTVGWVSG